MIVVDRDNVEITTSCTVAVGDQPIPDADGNGVIHITADDIRVEFSSGAVLRGTVPDAPPDTLTGTGIRITGKNVTLLGARVRGYKTAIHATGADRLILEDADVSGNFRQRLRSTTRAEDATDWLAPHENDSNEWLDRYGAGIYIEDAHHVRVRGVHARDVQNGVILDRVNDSLIVDNDCSFLSGWGLALWRSSRNVVTGNAFDFCVRGYSHEVYNRGQDSAGILMFEQCSENVIVRNSATHGGDGLFGFAGREALGEKDRRDDASWYAGRGNNANIIAGNDLSFAAAHGLEMTFSFDNQVRDNRFEGNAICGIWGGYSQRTIIGDNVFVNNGELGYGLERGGINIEHGTGNSITRNEFLRNRCGVHLWWDEDEGILKTPWAAANHPAAGAFRNQVDVNEFSFDDVALHVRHANGTTSFRGNKLVGVSTRIRSDGESPVLETGPPASVPALSVAVLPTELDPDGPVGRRPELRGRDKIIMTEWGPYDSESPHLHLVARGRKANVYELLGCDVDPDTVVLHVEPALPLRREGSRIIVGRASLGSVQPYVLTATIGDDVVSTAATLSSLEWSGRVFAYTVDPREDYTAWQREALERGAPFVAGPELNLKYGMGGPRDVLQIPHRVIDIGPDGFGTIAVTSVNLPVGRWRIRTTSDDGIRVSLDGELVIDDWTWHAPKEHAYEFEVAETREITIVVEHFELDGYAILTLDIEAAE